MATHAPLPCCRRSILKGQETLVIETSSGQHITCRTPPHPCSLKTRTATQSASMHRESPSPQRQSSPLTAAQVEISAPQVAVNAATVNFSGIIQADTVIANNVVASSITPGAGNVW
jgi:hypothetical protein